jgi:hypothetical protein
MLKNVARGTSQPNIRQALTQPAFRGNFNEVPPLQDTFPLSDNSYPSMELQVKNGQLRAKI